MNLVSSSSGSRSVSGRLGPIAGGAFMGCLGGGVAAAEAFYAFPIQAGAGMGAIMGAGCGAAARPLLRHGARGRLFPRTRPAAGTVLAALSLLLTAVVAVGISLRIEGRLPEDAELFVISVHVASLLVAAAAVIATVTAMGLAVRRAVARWTAVMMSSIMSTAALIALVAAPEHWEEPAALLISALATLAFSLAPSTGQDFRNA